MTDPQVFYNREDLWGVPRENYAGQTVPMQPYYVIMRLPGEAQAEYMLMLPMVPSGRDNMIAWMAARCDGADYGHLFEYAFSKDKLIYGPYQIQARINQNPEISRQLSLWNQMGSKVILGNLLVIPIEDSLALRRAAVHPRRERPVAGVAAGDRLLQRSRGDGRYA